MASKIIQGPFTLTWGANTLEDVEDVKVDFSQDETDYKTVQFQTRTITGAMKASISITLLKGDIAALGAIFPQYLVVNGETMSTGETVTDAEGAIDIKAAACDAEETFNDLEIEACDDPGLVLRLVNANAKLDSVEIDGKILKQVVKFNGQPEDTEAILQFFNRGSLGEVS